MSSGTGFIDTYLNDPKGRAFTLSLIIAILAGGLSGWIAVTDPVSESFLAKALGFFYADSDVSRWSLVALEWFLFMVIFVYLTIAFGNRKELMGGLPDWLEILVPGIIVLLFGAFISNLTYIGTQSGLDTNVEGLSNFTPDMRVNLFFLNLAGMILLTIYIYFAAKDEEEAR